MKHGRAPPAGRRLLPHQDVRRAHAAAAHHVTQAGAGVGHLTLAGLAAELERGLPDLGQARRSARMAARGQSAVGGERHRAAWTEAPLLDALLRLALAAEAQQLVVLELLDDEGVVYLHELDILGAEARLLVEIPRRVAAHLRRADHGSHEEVAALVHLAAQVPPAHPNHRPPRPEPLPP